jgi:hypothetical protein
MALPLVVAGIAARAAVHLAKKVNKGVSMPAPIVTRSG